MGIVAAASLLVSKVMAACLNSGFQSLKAKTYAALYGVDLPSDRSQSQENIVNFDLDLTSHSKVA
jgi:hypothetical protein